MSIFKKKYSDKIITERGFTLIELLIAMSIFSIGMLAVGSMQFASAKGNRTAQTVTTASTWSTSQIERLLLLPQTHPDLDPNNNPHQIINGRYIMDWNVQDDTPVNGIRTITVTVTWGAGTKQLNIMFIRS